MADTDADLPAPPAADVGGIMALAGFTGDGGGERSDAGPFACALMGMKANVGVQVSFWTGIVTATIHTILGAMFCVFSGFDHSFEDQVEGRRRLYKGFPSHGHETERFTIFIVNPHSKYHGTTLVLTFFANTVINFCFIFDIVMCVCFYLKYSQIARQEGQYIELALFPIFCSIGVAALNIILSLTQVALICVLIAEIFSEDAFKNLVDYDMYPAGFVYIAFILMGCAFLFVIYRVWSIFVLLAFKHSIDAEVRAKKAGLMLPGGGGAAFEISPAYAPAYGGVGTPP